MGISYSMGNKNNKEGKGKLNSGQTLPL